MGSCLSKVTRNNYFIHAHGLQRGYSYSFHFYDNSYTVDNVDQFWNEL